AKGEYPTEAPPRPQGMERNVVLTEWDWANGRFSHDITSTDPRNPSFNANGPVWGVSAFTGHFEAVYPKQNKMEEVEYPGPGKAHDIDTHLHNPMMDVRGRIWATDEGRQFLVDP